MQLRVARVGHVERREDAHDPLREGVSATARRRHRAHELDVADVLHLLFPAVVPETVVRPQLEQLQGGHEPEHRLLRHVEVVAEHHHSLTAGGRERALAPLLELALDDVLQRIRRGLRGEVHHAARVAVGKLLEALRSHHALAHAHAPDDQNVRLHRRQAKRHALRARRVDGGHDDAEERRVFQIGFVRRQLGLPQAPVARLGVHEVLVHRVFCRDARVQVANKRVKLFAALVVQRRAHRPHKRVHETLLDHREVLFRVVLFVKSVVKTGRGRVLLQRVEQCGELPHGGELVRLHELRATQPPELESGLHPLGQKRAHRRRERDVAFPLRVVSLVQPV
mmetsp:Transcript_8381/g.35020  ORF Transcript_8381/g.35020 Transcript_8381/m.35020 type:complete len:338 (+) Transcript_8381:5203-6216(+)